MRRARLPDPELQYLSRGIVVTAKSAIQVLEKNAKRTERFIDHDRDPMSCNFTPLSSIADI